MLLAELDMKADAWLIVIGFLVQGGALSALLILWRHHVKTIASHKREIEKKDAALHASTTVKDAAITAIITSKDAAVTTIIVAKDAEIKVREDACREELMSCQDDLREMEKAFRAKTEDLLREAYTHENEMLMHIRDELSSGGNK